MRPTQAAFARSCRLARTRAGWWALGALVGGLLPWLMGCPAPAPLDSSTFCARFVDARVAMLSSCGFLDAEQAGLTQEKILGDCNRMMATRPGPSWTFSLGLAQGCLDKLATGNCFPWVEWCQATHPRNQFGYVQCTTDIDVQTVPEECLPFELGTPKVLGSVCDPRQGCGSRMLSCTGSDQTCGMCTEAPVVVPMYPCGGCAETSYCDGKTKTCLPKKAAREACLFAGECLDRPCVQGVCDYVALGAACTDAYCEPGAYCRGLLWYPSYMNPSPPTPGVCTTRVPTGGACTDGQFDDGCADPRATCLEGVCRIMAPHSLKAGAVCDAQVQCESPLLCSGLVTAGVGNGVCKADELGSSGEPCGYAPRHPSCRYLLSCGWTGTCLPDPLVRLDQSCTDSNQCLEGTCQSSGSAIPAVCAPPIEDGEDCTLARDGCLHGRCIADCPAGCSNPTYHCAPPC